MNSSEKIIAKQIEWAKNRNINLIGSQGNQVHPLPPGFSGAKWQMIILLFEYFYHWADRELAPCPRFFLKGNLTYGPI